jgi:hypothetical protein
MEHREELVHHMLSGGDSIALPIVKLEKSLLCFGFRRSDASYGSKANKYPLQLSDSDCG